MAHNTEYTREAVRCKQEGASRVILFNLCGHGHFDALAGLPVVE